MPARELEHLRYAFQDMVGRLVGARGHRPSGGGRTRCARKSSPAAAGRQAGAPAIGVLVSGIAHELNNLLQSITVFAELPSRSAHE
jgi:hypothetical protein